MKAGLVKNVKGKETLVLSNGQTFWHFSVVPFLLIVPISIAIDAFKAYVTDSYTGVRPITDLIPFGLLWTFLPFAFYFIQKRKLRFRIINMKVDSTTFSKVVEKIATELEWEFIEKKSNIVIAKSGFSFRSWGERITIIREEDRILFNSICDPENKPSVTSAGMNRLNRKLFERFLRESATDPKCSNSTSE